LQAEIAKNSQKTSFWGLRSCKVVNVDKSKNPDTSACYDMQHVCSLLICNRIHTIRANSGKITSFRRVPLFGALVRGEPLHPTARNFATIN